MSKYEPLSERLRGHAGDEWRATFSDVEQVLGFQLPKGARTGRKWWTNDPDKAHSRAWAGQGWEAEIDPSAETVIFRRSAASPAVIQQVAGLEPLAEGVRVQAPDAEPAPRPPMAMESGASGAEAPKSEVAPPAEAPAQDTRKGPKLPKGAAAGAVVAGAAALVAGLGTLAFRRWGRR